MMMFLGILFMVIIVYVAKETLWVRVSEHTVGLPSAAGVKVLQLSDLHGQIRFLNGTISGIVNRLNPDYVMLTGDLVSRLGQFEAALRELKRIKCGSIFFVPGNYEREGREGLFRKRIYSEQEYESMLSALREANITVLTNAGCPIPLQGKRGLVYGFDNSVYGNERLQVRPEELGEYDYVIMLAHSPKIITLLEENGAPYDLLLTGHTHGGQIRVLAHTRGAYKHYHTGMKRLDERRHFFINRGLGTVKLPIRIGSPPEIVLFHMGD